MTDPKKGHIFSGTNRSEVRKRVGFAAEVFEKYSDEIRAFIHFNVKDKSKADDIFQELFVSIVRKPIPSDVHDLQAYLYRVVTNDVIDLSRQITNHRDHIQKYAECCKIQLKRDDPQKIAIQVESTKRMFQLIESSLPKREAEVVLERFGRGFSIKDTAERMHVNERIVSRYLSIALKKMRQIVSVNEDEIT
jgi:RNA polymerase sigma-70 factor (ECF subfamily)